jgi:periplasmic divalent cation tolerance protein
MMNKIVILSTCSNEQEGERLARVLLDGRLAACVTLIPRVRSFYPWKGAIESADECLLLIKSSQEFFGPLRARLEEAHSYEVPEVLALPVIDGAEKYLNWLDQNLGKPSESGG